MDFELNWLCQNRGQVQTILMAANARGGTVFSRRVFFRISGAGVLSDAALRVLDIEPPSFSLLKDFGKAAVRAISPDGKKLLIEDWAESGHPLRVIEFGTWQTIYSGTFG